MLGRNTAVLPTPPSWHRQTGNRGRFYSSFGISFVVSLVRFHTFWDRPGWRARGSSQRVALHGRWTRN